ncbi:MAG: HD domain-containing protein [Bacteroidales bacterium]
MNAIEILKKHLGADTELYRLVLSHSHKVATKAIEVAQLHPELEVDQEFIYQAALLHVIGVGATYAPDIHCKGTEPYIRHGIIGSELLEAEGHPRHALVCERHTGTGISLYEIVARSLPLPHRDMMPISEEEQIICFADKFFSKSNPTQERTIEEVRKSIARFGQEGLTRFDAWTIKYL